MQMHRASLRRTSHNQGVNMKGCHQKGEESSAERNRQNEVANCPTRHADCLWFLSPPSLTKQLLTQMMKQRCAKR